MKVSPDTENPADANALGLHSDDLEDLRRSGLSESTIAAMGCFSVESEEVQRRTGSEASSPGYAIPYRGLLDQTGEEYTRYRLRRGEKRYVAGRGEDTQVYDPPGRAELQGDMLVITEGEKKAAKAVQEGIACVGIQGVQSWCDAGGRAVEKAAEIPVNVRTAPIAKFLTIAKQYKRVLALGEPCSLPLIGSLVMEPECGGGLLLSRHVTPLPRRNMVYFSSGAYRKNSHCAPDQAHLRNDR